MSRHENYLELIWTLAKTDFKLRYHGSVLGYFWALLKPMMMFLILNFVFSSIFNPRNTGIQFFSLQLLSAIVVFNFFQEGTNAGMMSLLNKSTLVTKIYIPRWTIILASTLNAAMIFLMNLLIVAVFFVYYRFVPSGDSLLVVLFLVVLNYFLILIFSFAAAPLFVRFRDMMQIWDLALTVLFYASPIVYPLTLLPAQYHKFILLNPIAFIIHYVKMSLTQNHYPSVNQLLLFAGFVVIAGLISMGIYRKMDRRIAEMV